MSRDVLSPEYYVHKVVLNEVLRTAVGCPLTNRWLNMFHMIRFARAMMLLVKENYFVDAPCLLH
jgi:hypothetical protein